MLNEKSRAQAVLQQSVPGFIALFRQCFIRLLPYSQANLKSVQNCVIVLVFRLFIQVYSSAHDVIRADAGGIDSIPGGGGGVAHAVTIVYDLI